MRNNSECELLKVKKRKLFIMLYVLFIIVFFAIAIWLSITIFFKDHTNTDVNYIEKSNIDYKVYLKDNEFFSEKYLGKDNQYIANLIDYIEAEFNYKLNSPKEEIYNYAYKIVAEVNVREKNTNNLIYSFKEDLLPETKEQTNGKEDLSISKTIDIDYEKYNELINEFVGVYDLDNQVSSVTVSMYVDLTDNSESEERAVMEIDIPLTTKTIAIDISSNEVNGTREVKNNTNLFNQKEIYVLAISLIVVIVLIVKLYIFIIDTQNEKTIYKMKIRRILSNYGTYIQKIEKDFNFEGYQSIEMKDFKSLLQIRDILGQPILMLERKEESYFMVPTQSKIVYIFELNAGKTKKRIEESYEKIEQLI